MNDAAQNVVPVDDLFAGLETKGKSNEGIEIEIMKADGDSSGLFVRVRGQDSDEYARLKERQDRARIRAMSQGGRAALGGLYDVGKTNEMELTIACCIGWRHASGRTMPFALGADEEETRKFFTAYPLVYDQVRIGIADRMNFTKVPAKS